MQDSRLYLEPYICMVKISEVIIKLILSAILGGIIGYQRELKDRPAGFRTHVMVSAGSTIFMLVSTFEYRGLFDPTRIAAGVVTGIGFLGAGTIIRQGSIVIGLTTAASLWSVAAIGLAVGAGFYSAAIAGTVIIFLALTLFKTVETRFIVKKEHHLLRLRALDEPGQLGRIKAAMEFLKVEIESIEFERSQSGRAVYHLAIEIPPQILADNVFEKVAAVEGVESVRWEM